MLALLCNAMEVIEMKAVEKNNSIEVFDIKISSLGENPVSGYFARPLNCKKKSRPAMLWTHGGGVRSSIILTHGHGDHTGGVSVFTAEGTPDIWTCDNFGDKSHVFKAAGLTFTRKRGARQGGFMLPPEKRINNGVAQAYYPKRGGRTHGRAFRRTRQAGTGRCKGIGK